MPNRWPISSGNWSDSAIWSGSLIPTAADDVYANNQLVTVDQDIIVRTLNNINIAGVAAGGTFFLTNGVRVQAVINGSFGNYLMGSTAPAAVTISGSNTAYITGSLSGGPGNYAVAVSMSDASNLYITGSVTTGGSSLGCMGILSTSTGIISISGSIDAGLRSALGGAGIWMVAPTTLIVTGSIIAHAGGGANGYGVYAASNSTISVQGNVTGGSGGTCYGIIAVQSASIYVNGQVRGGVGTVGTNNAGITAGIGATIIISGSVSGSTGNNSPGILNSSINNIIVTGSVDGGAGSACYGITNSGNGFIFVTGSVNSRGNNSGIYSTAASVTIVVRGPISASFVASPPQQNNGLVSTGLTATNIFTGPFYNTGSFNAVYAYRMQMLSTSSHWTFDTEVAGVSKTLYTSNTLPGVPRQTDVRRGTQYNFGLTGSLEMPDPTTVKTGVAVDNTTGSAILTPQDMFDVATQTLTTSGSIGNLLTGASTVQTVGATISSFKV
jgi:hypothetical protein